MVGVPDAVSACPDAIQEGPVPVGVRFFAWQVVGCERVPRQRNKLRWNAYLCLHSLPLCRLLECLPCSAEQRPV